MIPFRLPALPRIALRHQVALALLAVVLIAFAVLVAMAGLVPPEERRAVRLDRIAAALRGPGDVVLTRTVVAGPPAESSDRWLEAPGARRRLAALLRVPVTDVRLFVQTPVRIRSIDTAMAGQAAMPASFFPLGQEGTSAPAEASPPQVVVPTPPVTQAEPPARARETRPTTSNPGNRPPARPRIVEPDRPPSPAADRPRPATVIMRQTPLPPTRATMVAPPPGVTMRPAVAVSTPMSEPAVIDDQDSMSVEVAGPFLAALRLPAGGWALVRPVVEGFPTTLQQRMILWFLVALATAAPLAWVAGFLIARPLDRFADDITRSGRDPASPLPGDGPVELAGVATAMVRMRARVRGLATDRTALAGVLRTELRTPLARLRAGLDDAPWSVREAFNDDLIDIEEATTAIELFLQDAEATGELARHDLGELVRVASRMSVERGAEIAVDAPVPVWVDADAEALMRAIGMLARHTRGAQGNAITMTVSVDETVAIVSAARSKTATAAFVSGLHGKADVADTPRPAGGELAVVRSIVRAHRGAVRLVRTDEGMMTQIGLPIAR